jgi:hypothetical protein
MDQVSPIGSERSNLRLVRMTVMLAAVAVVVVLPMKGQQASPVTVRVHTESGVPVEGARVRVEQSASRVVERLATSNGTVDFLALGPGTYQILVTSQGYEPSSQALVLTSTQRELEVDFTLVPTLEVKQSIEVRGSTQPEVEQTSTPPSELHRDEVKSLPGRPASVADTLPLVPGITRTPDGEIQIGGTGEHRSALVVNATDVTDPATAGSASPFRSIASSRSTFSRRPSWRSTAVSLPVLYRLRRGEVEKNGTSS